MRIRSFVYIVFISCFYRIEAQLIENFDDGDFKDGIPLYWDVSQVSGGDDFVISNGEVRSNGPDATDAIYFSTNLDIDFNNYDASWSFKVRYEGGAPSSGNSMIIYLMSNQPDLTDSPEGYYIKMGENGSGDGVDLFATSGDKIINDENDLVAVALDIHIRVSRSSEGVWVLEADTTDSESFFEIGTASHSDFDGEGFFGLMVSHTKTKKDLYFMDDFTLDTTLVQDETPPEVRSATALSSQEVAVLFSEEVERSTAEDVSNYDIDKEVEVMTAVRDEASPSLVHLTTSGFTNGDTYTLTVNNVEDLNGNVIGANQMFDFEYLLTEAADFEDIVINEFLSDPEDGNDDFVELFNRSDKFIDLSGWTLSDASTTSKGFADFVFRPGHYLILHDKDATIDYPAFGDAISVGNLTLNNDHDQIELLSNEGERMAFLAYAVTPEEGVSSELINPNDACISYASYVASVSANGGTPGTENSVFDDRPDEVSPVIFSFHFDEGLRIDFSETMDALSLLSGTYEVNGLTIDEVTIPGDFPSSVAISFAEEIKPGTIYSFMIANVLDCAGNRLEDVKLEFGVGRTPTFNEVLITEIFSDPDPVAGLPEREFIEIYNATDELISMEGMALTDATETISLPAITLGPGSYYVLTRRSGVSSFPLNSIGVPNFPSLNNDGELLILSLEASLIFSVEYEVSWHDSEKSEGGYSLEMKDVTNPCAGRINWGSSLAGAGGTPGSANSYSETIPDRFGPEVIDVVAISKDTVRIDFSEKIDPTSTVHAKVETQPFISIGPIGMELKRPQSLFVQLNDSLVASDPITLSIANVFDCEGNQVTKKQTLFSLPRDAEENEVLLSEVLFNPRVNGVDFVEVFNQTDDYLSLKGWQLARITDSGIANESVLSEEELVVEPKEYLVFTTDVEALMNNYPKAIQSQILQLHSLPAYANDTGNVVLLNGEGVIQEHFRYDENFHYGLLESSDGVSLERISFSNPTNDPNNWRSAASTEGFATPGYANSQAIDASYVSGSIQVAPKVFIPGNAGTGRDFTTINYQFDRPGKFANVSIYDASGRLVKTLLQGASLATSGLIRWDGLTNSGTVSRLGYYLIHFEVYDSNGHTESYKETVVVGR